MARKIIGEKTWADIQEEEIQNPIDTGKGMVYLVILILLLAGMVLGIMSL